MATVGLPVLAWRVLVLFGLLVLVAVIVALPFGVYELELQHALGEGAMEELPSLIGGVIAVAVCAWVACRWPERAVLRTILAYALLQVLTGVLVLLLDFEGVSPVPAVLDAIVSLLFGLAGTALGLAWHRRRARGAGPRP